jgi:PIN domain nuclease of toxin-antitoxin system
VIAYLDTQVVVHLVQGKHDWLTARAKAVIESSDLLISPVVSLELEYLYEIGRLRVGAADLLLKLNSDIGLEVCSKPFTDIVDIALHQKWTRDPFDRMIVSHAKLNGIAPLVTSDTKIRENYINAVW